jgi:hypothetical protein
VNKKADASNNSYLEVVREEDYYALGEAISLFRNNKDLKHSTYQELLDNIFDKIILCHEMKLTEVVMDNIQYGLNKRRGFIKNDN